MSSQDELQIRDLLMSYARTLNTSDANAAASLYHTEGVFMPIGFPSSKGTSNIHAAYAGIFDTIQLNVSFEIEEIEVDHNMAMAGTSSEGTVTVLAEKLKVPEANRELFVLRKQDGNWKIYRYMFNKTNGQSN